MSGSKSPVWRDGQGVQLMVPPEGAKPVREAHKANPRDLWVEYVHLTLYNEDGTNSVGSAMLNGQWARKSDGQPGSRKGNILLTGPLTAEEGAPDWLIARIDRLLRGLDRAYREAEL